jgi:hypothetical protein
MTLETKFPRVLETQSIKEFSVACYQALYENNEEAKKYIRLVEVNYCSLISTLGENEKAYMQIYISKGLGLAKRIKKINRRNFIRKEKAEFNKAVSLEDALINKNRYSEALGEIKNDELEKTRNICGKAVKTLTPLTTSTSFVISSIYCNIPKEPSALIAGVAGITTYATIKILGSRKTKKAIQECCEAQTETERYYIERVKQIENNYSDELLAIEGDKESEIKKHVSRGVRDLKKSWKFYGIDLRENVDSDLLIKMLA